MSPAMMVLQKLNQSQSQQAAKREPAFLERLTNTDTWENWAVDCEQAMLLSTPQYAL